MEDLAERYPQKWLGIKGRRVVAVADSKHELERAAEPLADEHPILLLRILVNPDEETAAEVAKNPMAFGRLSFRGADGRVQEIEVLQSMNDDETDECTAAQLIERLRDVRYRSVSFDLHSTLLLPTGGINEVVYNAFKDVLIENGCIDRVVVLEDLFREGAADFVTDLSTNYYRRMDPLLETMPEFLQHPARRWVTANSYTIAQLIAGDPDNISVLIDRLGHGDVKRSQDRLIRMGWGVQKRISGSRSENWYTTEEQRGIIRATLKRGLLIAILSNGMQSSVSDCAKRYFPEIPSWQVFTPQALKDTGKPSLTNAALFLMSLGCAMVRNAIEGRPAPEEAVRALPRRRQGILGRWMKSRAAVANRVYRELTDSQKTGSIEAPLSIIRDALREFCARMKMPESTAESLMIMPHQHLHVGNSDYHDSLPFVGLGLPFDYALYSAKDDGKQPT